jgi:HEAT repeat protein
LSSNQSGNLPQQCTTAARIVTGVDPAPRELVDVARAWLVQQGAEARTALRPLLEHTSALTREVTAELFVEIGTTDDIPLLVERLDDSSMFVRQDAAAAIASILGVDVIDLGELVPEMLDIVDDSEPTLAQVRRAMQQWWLANKAEWPRRSPQ